MTKHNSETLLAIALLLLTTGCAVVRAPKRAYQFAYCDKMSADGKHCQVWAPSCPGDPRCQGR